MMCEEGATDQRRQKEKKEEGRLKDVCLLSISISSSLAGPISAFALEYLEEERLFDHSRRRCWLL